MHITFNGLSEDWAWNKPGDSMSDTLRAHILATLGDHSRTGSAESKSDKDIATATGQDVAEIQRQLDILESEDLVALAKTMGPTYGARIKPKGMAVMERLRAAAPKPPTRRIGF